VKCYDVTQGTLATAGMSYHAGITYMYSCWDDYTAPGCMNECNVALQPLELHK